MTSLTGDTDVFTSASGGGEAPQRALVMLIARRQDFEDIYRDEHRRAILQVLDQLADEGWVLSLRGIFDPNANDGPCALDTGFTHDHDVAAVFEAPDIDSAMAGTVRLEKAGWARLFRTEWLLGVKEFAPVLGNGAFSDHCWAFLALWEWNDQWCHASPEERAEYDLECDIAFKGDLELGVNIAGRYRMDWSHGWHHLGAWEIRAPVVADAAIRGHETVADFKFTTSRHIIGRLEPLAALLAPRLP